MKWWILAVLLLPACTKVQEIDRSKLEAERFFFATTDVAGAVLEVSEIHQTDAAAQVVFPIEGETEEVLIVGLTDAQLRSVDERYEPSRANMLHVLVKPPGEPTLYFEGDEPFLEVALPSELKVIDANTDAEATVPQREQLAKAISLRLPVSLERCAEDHPMQLVPFGATRELLGDGVPGELSGDRYTEIIDVIGAEERAVVLTRAAVFVVPRGGAVDAGLMLSTVDPYVENAVLPATSLAANMALKAHVMFFNKIDGEYQFLLLGNEREVGRIWRLALGVNGVRLIREYSVDQPAHPAQLRDIMVDGQDIAVAVGDDGLIVTSEAARLGFTLVTPPVGAEGRLLHTAPTHILTQPHAFAADTPMIYLGYAFGEYWDAVNMSQRVNSLIASIDGDDLWAAGDGGMVARFRDSMWSEPDLQYPASIAGCGVRDHDTGRVKIQDSFIGGTIDASFVYLQAKSCNAVLRVRRSDLCVSPIEEAGAEAVQFVAGERKVMSSWSGPTMVVGGPRGLLLEISR